MNGSCCSQLNDTELLLTCERRTCIAPTNAYFFHCTRHRDYCIYDSRRISNAHEYDCHSEHAIYKKINIKNFSQFSPFCEGHFGGCGINEEVSQWMDSVQNAGVDDEANAFGDDGKRKAKTPKKFADAKMLKRNKLMDAKEFFKDDLKYPHMKYTKEANLKDNRASSVGDGNGGAAIDDDVDDDEWHRRSHARAKRAARPKEENRNTCSLYIQTDPLIWRHIREGIADVRNPHCTPCSSIDIYLYFYSFFFSSLSVPFAARSWP